MQTWLTADRRRDAYSTSLGLESIAIGSSDFGVIPKTAWGAIDLYIRKKPGPCSYNSNLISVLFRWLTSYLTSESRSFTER